MRRVRGQAVVETVVFLPMMMFALSAVIWSAREAVLYERASSAVRYSGMILAPSGEYKELTLDTLYRAASAPPLGAAPAGPACSHAPASFLDAAQSFNNVSTSRASFFSPSSTAIPTACKEFVVGWTSSFGFTRDLVLIGNYDTVAAGTHASGVASAFGGLTKTHATGSFFRQPDLTTLTECYPQVQAAIYASLVTGADWKTDTTPILDESGNTNATWMPPTPGTAPLAISPHCASGPSGPQGPIAPPTVVPSAPGPYTAPGNANGNGSGPTGGGSGGTTSG